MIQFGRVPANTVLYIPFATYGKTNGESITLTGLAVTDIEIYKDGGTTQRSSDDGYALLDTDGIDFDGITGIHGFSINLASDTDAGFYAVGSQYWVVVSAVTVDGQTVNFIAAVFRIVPAEDLAGRPKVDVAAWLGTTVATPTVGGVPEVDLTHVAGATTNVAALATNVDAILTDTADMQPKLGTPAGASISADILVIDNFVDGLEATIGAAGAGLTAIPWNAAWDTEVQSEVDDALVAQRLDELLNADSDIDGAAPPTVGSVFHELLTKTTGSFTYDQTTDSLEAIRDRGDAAWATATGFSTHSAADVWAVATRVLTAGTNIVLPSNGLSSVVAWTVDITGSLSGSVGSVTGAVGSVTGAVGSVTGNVGGNVTGTIGGLTAAALKDFFDTDSTTNYAGAVAGSVVKEIADNAAGSGLDAAGVRAAIGLASANLDTQLSTIDDFLDTEVAAILAAVDTEVAAIKTKTDFLPSVTAGAAGGVFIAGSNAATTADTLTITGALTAGSNAIPWNAAYDAEVQSEVQDAIEVNNLDHLMKVAVVDTQAMAEVVDNTVLGNILSKSASTTSYDPTTDSLEALRDRGDAAWTTAVGFSTLTEADVRNAVGLAAANLDTQLDDLPTNAELTAALDTADDATLAAIAALNNLSAAEVNTEVDTALSDIRLDELLAADSDIDGAAPPTVGSVFHELLTKTAGSFTYDQTTDSLEALRDRGDSGAWASSAALQISWESAYDPSGDNWRLMVCLRDPATGDRFALTAGATCNAYIREFGAVPDTFTLALTLNLVTNTFEGTKNAPNFVANRPYEIRFVIVDNAVTYSPEDFFPLVGSA